MSQKENSLTKKKILTKGNPNITFIKTRLENKNILAFLDTGAALCFGRKRISLDWKKLSKLVKIIVADKSVHQIDYAIEHKILIIEGKKFPKKNLFT